MPPTTWLKAASLLRAKGALDLFDLNAPACADSIADLEHHVGASIPEDLKDVLLLHDGQGDGHACGLFFGDELLSVAGIRSHWDNWRSLEGDRLNEELGPSMTSEPLGFMKCLYHSRGWIPFTHDGGGNHTGVDLDPDARGTSGQVIAFGRDLNSKRVLAASTDRVMEQFYEWLQSVAWDLRHGHWHFEEAAYKKHYHGWPVL